MSTDSLEALLHRCHRDELLPLATLVGVNPRGLGLGDLARAVAMAVRQQASHELGNMLLRKGRGRAYPEILAALAARRGLPSAGAEETELAVLRTAMAERWDGLDAERRAALWAELGLHGAPPSAGTDAVMHARQELGRSFGYAVSTSIAREAPRALRLLALSLMMPPGCLLRPFVIPFAPLLLLWWLKPDEKHVVDIVLEVARLRQIVLHRVTIGVVGSPSTGKDAAIKTLFGIDTGNVSPVAGSTKEVSIQRVPGATAMYLVNTPGLGDVVESVTEEARQVLDHIDVYLYLVNAEGGVQARELADYGRCRATGKPVLAIVNKVDVLRPRDRERFLEDARSKLDAPAEDFVAVAFDPLPQLAEAPINVGAVRDWLALRLTELGKDVSELPQG